MLAHRLFFTKTEAGFRDVIDQTLSDFITASRDGRVLEPGARKFCKISGVTTPAPTDLTSMPTIDLDVFRKRAQWGTRGASGVGTCTNHIEGLHGRLNQATEGQRSILAKLSTIVTLIREGARGWSAKVARRRRKTNKDLILAAERNECRSGRCPAPDFCDRGFLETRRLGLQFPCVHEILTRPVDMTSPIQFELEDHGEARMRVTV
jgi:hypothetical protein